MKATDFDFDLPESSVAYRPADPRGSSRLLVLHPDGSVNHRTFGSLPEYLREGDLLLLNDTKVLPARLTGKKSSGGRIDLLLVKEQEPGVWEILSREKYTGTVYVSKEVSGAVINGKSIHFGAAEGSGIPDVAGILQRTGLMPLPPYIKRKPDEKDREHYQTVYANKIGSIAAPTAGLHFTADLLAAIERKGVIIRFLTLHVGTGTFRPVRAEDVRDHKMDSEDFEMDASLIEAVREAKGGGKRIISVGTTSTRAIEGFFSGKCVLEPGSAHCGSGAAGKKSVRGRTNIFIHPGYSFKVVDSLLTNFHLPRSTPLMLASAFAGFERLMEAYKSAISGGYRFFSYGDAMLILR